MNFDTASNRVFYIFLDDPNECPLQLLLEKKKLEQNAGMFFASRSKSSPLNEISATSTSLICSFIISEVPDPENVGKWVHLQGFGSEPLSHVAQESNSECKLYYVYSIRI